MARLLVVISVLVACGGAATRPRKPGDEYLSAIRIEGNTAIDTDDLLPRLGLQHSAETQRAVDDYQLQLDTQRIATAFQKLGYFAVDVRSRVDRKGDAVVVVFTVAQGVRAKTHVEISGLPSDVPLAKVRSLVALDEGGPFDYAAFDDAKDTMQRFVEDAGYAHAHIESSVVADRIHATATLLYAIDPGPRATFGAIEITGVDGMLADAVRARITFATGDHYSTSATVATQNAIYGMARFSTVRVDADREGTAAVVPVKIRVTELTKNDASAGGGFGLDPLTYSIRVRGSYTRRGVPFLTPLTSFALDARPEYAFEHIDNAGNTCGIDLWHCKRDPRIRLLATLTQQDLLFTDVKGQLEAGYDYLTIEPYTRTGPHFRAGLSTPVGTKRLQASAGWQYSIQDFVAIFIDQPHAAALGITQTDVIDRSRDLDHRSAWWVGHANSARGIERTNYVGAYTGALVLDLRDKPIEPTKGVYVESRIAKGTPYAAGSFDYLQLTSEARGFVPVGPLVIAARVRYGTITGDVPATERYFGGGTSSQRGFAQRGLTPTAPSADPTNMTPIGIGGAGIVETSLDVRGPLGTYHGVAVGGVVFLDGGNVTNAASELDVWDQFWAVGVGVRWMSPIGPVGGDIAYRLNRIGEGGPNDGGHMNYLIAVGEAF